MKTSAQGTYNQVANIYLALIIMWRHNSRRRYRQSSFALLRLISLICAIISTIRSKKNFKKLAMSEKKQPTCWWFLFNKYFLRISSKRTSIDVRRHLNYMKN